MVLVAIKTFRTQRGLIPRYLAEPVAAGALHGLRQMAGLGEGEVSISGAMRRLCETVPEIELLATDDPEATLEAFSRLALFREEVQRSPSGILCLTRERYPVRSHVVPPSGWAWALQRTTGSAAHNAQLDERAGALGRAVPEAAAVGVAAVPADARDLADETAVYARLGLPLIPAELREGRGEIAAVLTGRLPRLIEPGDLRGDLHTHSTWSDGHDSIGDHGPHLPAPWGGRYIAVSDHSQSLGVARGLTLERLAEQQEEIAAWSLRPPCPGCACCAASSWTSARTDRLDYPGDEALARFDFVTASIYSGFGQSAERLTERVVAALRSPHVDAIGHLTGRILGWRERWRSDVEAVLRVAAETGTAMEINAWPNRLDLNEDAARPRKQLGVKLVINTDAHAADQLDYLHYGVEIARRAWMSAGDVLNTRPPEELLRRRGRAEPILSADATDRDRRRSGDPATGTARLAVVQPHDHGGGDGGRVALGAICRAAGDQRG